MADREQHDKSRKSRRVNRQDEGKAPEREEMEQKEHEGNPVDPPEVEVKTEEPLGETESSPLDGESAPAEGESGASPPGSAADVVQEGPASRPGEHPEDRFPIVGIGASAGGLEALETFFTNMPADSGMAFVVISHTDPERISMLPGLLRNKTRMDVRVVESGMRVQPNTVYLPPSDKDLSISRDAFQLTAMHKVGSIRLPIDAFFRNLAEECRDRAVGIVLSGTGSDGTQGIRFIKEKGGMTLAQSEATARYGGMPWSAISTGMVDYVLAPSEIPGRLNEYFRHPIKLKLDRRAVEEGGVPKELRKILLVLSNRTGHDFSLYKKSTLVRRIERRMAVNRIGDPAKYVDFLYRQPSEIDTLFQELLIGVTSFFRDPDAFEYLGKKVLPDLISQHGKESSLRVWVPGCSTGEEVYSLAMLISEALEEQEATLDFQIFGTDIDRMAIEKARESIYPQNIAADITPKRLERFFIKEGEFFKIRKDIRDRVIFAIQDVLRDPPFSNLDLLACRNLLIYLESQAQKKLLPLFHYTLKPRGVLFLGTSESVGSFDDLFVPVSKKWSIYRKRDVNIAARPPVYFPTGQKTRPETGRETGEITEALMVIRTPGIEQVTSKFLLDRYTPACVVVNHKGDIRYIHGRTGKYLELAQGHPELNITALAREGLRFPLMSALRQAVNSNTEVVREGLEVMTNGGIQHVKLLVTPMKEPEHLRDTVMILFEDQPPPQETARGEGAEGREGVNRRILELEHDLARAQQDYRTALEELETSNEELKSVNEEIQSANEELQSTNEELESSREELQSLNEELSTVNAELHEKIQEVSEAYSTITDVLNSTRVAILFLNNDLQVVRFTDEAARLINLIDSDIGRPIVHISTNLHYDGLVEDVREVIERLTPKETEVKSYDGHWYMMRMMPYRTRENRLEGAVITLIEIDRQMEAQQRAEELKSVADAAREFAENIVDTVRESLVVLDEELRVVSANRSFYDKFHVGSAETEGMHIFELGDGQWDNPELRAFLDRIVSTGESFKEFRVEHTFPHIGHKVMRLNARKLRRQTMDGGRILLAIEDVMENEASQPTVK